MNVGFEKAILLHCDQEITDLLKERVRGISFIDCRGFEQSSILDILNNEAIRSESKDKSEIEASSFCFVIFSGIENAQIRQAIDYIKNLSQRKWIFATTTSSNLNWSFEQLQIELISEYNYFNSRRDSSER